VPTATTVYRASILFMRDCITDSGD
jgi:hypothetical protein